MASYNPYNAVKSISELKGKYHTARGLGGDYMQYQNEAVKYYDELRKNGQQDVADELAASDYIKSLDILGRYKADTSVDDFYDSLTKIGTGDKRTVSEQQTDYIDKLMGIGTGETSPQTSDAVSKLMDQWFADNQTYIDRSGELHDAGMSGLDSLLNYDYTQQSFYQPIMDSYNLFGENAANGALASGASGNAGNIDSYAAANAARQQLAFTNAGHQAALAAAAQNQGSYLDLYGMMGANNSDLRMNNATTMNAINNMYSTDANERQAANDVIRQLFGDESAERVNATNAMVDKYLADLGLVQSQHVTDAEERMNTENNEYSLALQKVLGEYGLSEAEIKAAADRYDTLMGYNSDLANYATQERMNTADNTAERTRQYYENQYAKEQAEREHKNALDELYAKNNLVRDTTTYTPEQAGTVVYNGILEGAEEFSDIKSFEDLYSYVAQISGDPTGSAKVVKSIKEQHPTLFGGSAASGSQTFDWTALLK